MWTLAGLFLLGLVLIVRGGDWFLDGAVSIAQRTGLPRFLIGATVVSMATTLPELMVSVTGVLSGERALAVGNAVGSVTANTGLILGISLLCMPGPVRDRLRWAMMAAGAVMLTLVCRSGTAGIPGSVLLLLLFHLFLVNALLDAGSRRESGAGQRGKTEYLRFFLGLAAIAAGSRLLITNGSGLALELGVPARIVGVTMIAVGTSLPELVTTVTALMRGETALSVGNIVGANLIDLTLILPICTLLSGGQLPVGQQTAAVDLPVCLGLILIAAVPALLWGRLCRWQGALLLALYGGYLAWIV